MAVGQKTVLGRAQVQAACSFVEHHKIVARTLHFGKANVHGRIIARPACTAGGGANDNGA
jgi:hypothetical protein